jgi:very-short-patch-repair endonuclease
MARDPRQLVGEAGWVPVAELLADVSRSTLRNWVAAGKLVRLRPGVLALPTAAGNWRTRVAAALHGREAVASSVTALALWDLMPHPPGPVHVTVDPRSSGRGSAGVVVHRAADAYTERRRVDGLPASSAERAVVDAWAGSRPEERSGIRAAAITGVRRRVCSPRELQYELTRRSALRGRTELLRLSELLADGCQSELEIWGCLHVLRAPGMPTFVQQRWVRVGSEAFALDAACEESMLAVEMDGAAWHGSRTQREADIRRDALVATVGWQTLRFSYARMTRSPEACRREIRAVHTARLRLLRGGAGR